MASPYVSRPARSEAEAMADVATHTAEMLRAKGAAIMSEDNNWFIAMPDYGIGMPTVARIVSETPQRLYYGPEQRNYRGQTRRRFVSKDRLIARDISAYAAQRIIKAWEQYKAAQVEEDKRHRNVMADITAQRDATIAAIKQSLNGEAP